MSNTAIDIQTREDFVFEDPGGKEALSRIEEEREDFLIPEDRAIGMIRSCADLIAQAQTIPEVKRLITRAEALDLLIKKFDASSAVQRAALALLVESEQQLGRLTKQIPQGVRGAGAVPGQATKAGALKTHGIHKFRAQIAEKLAATPSDVLRIGIDAAKTKTVSGVAVALGYRAAWREPEDRHEKNLSFLADEAIRLLENLLLTGKPPPAPTVKEYRKRWSTLTGKGM